MVHARFTAAHAARDGELVRAGDSASLGLLFERYRPRLYALALSLLGFRAGAEDAVHDAFVTALARLPQLTDAQAVGGWLHTIVRNRCLMELRRRSAIETPVDDAEAALADIAVDACLERQVESAHLRDWVWSALQRLPEAHRVTVMLRYFCSYDSYEEVAAILGTPVGTVRSRLSDAKLKLAEQLLACAGRADDEGLARQRERERLCAQAFAGLYRGERAAFLEQLEPELEIRWSSGETVRGRRHFEADVDEDLRAGVRVHLQRVLASGNVTVLEASLVNPADDPAHCPPGGAMVLLHGPRQVRRMHLHLAARAPAEGE